MLTRRTILLGAVAAPSFGAYGFGVEPMLLDRITRYRVCPPGWPANLKLTVAAVADVHACEPWMDRERIEGIVAATNALNADVVVLLGDYVAGHDKVTGFVPDRIWAEALSGLRAPLGVFAILGNHDWWRDTEAQARGHGPIAARIALERAGVPVLENDSVAISKDGQRIWIAGLGDQWALHPRTPGGDPVGVDDLAATLGAVSDDAPILLLAHEPDIFPKVPERVALTLSGHTHGGQVRLPFVTPYAPSELSRKYIYGHYLEGGRNLIVSGGLGCSWWPVRIGVPPEILLIEIGALSADVS